MTESAKPSCARAALFDSSRRDVSRPCAAECEPLVRAPTSCHADVSRRRALTRRSDVQTLITVLGTCFGTPEFELPYDGERPSCARAALFDSSRRDASRPCAAECEPLARAPANCHAVVNRRRALTRRSDAHTLVTVVGTCFSTQSLKYPCDGECATDAPMTASSASLLQLARGSSNPQNIKTKSEANDSQPRANHDRTLIL